MNEARAREAEIESIAHTLFELADMPGTREDEYLADATVIWDKHCYHYDICIGVLAEMCDRRKEERDLWRAEWQQISALAATLQNKLQASENEIKLLNALLQDRA